MITRCPHADVLGSAVLVLLLVIPAGEVAADAAAGEKAFAQCAGCHAIGPGAADRFGPQLNGLMSRGAGQAAGYAYSDAFSSAVEGGMEWDEATLDAYFAAPMQKIPGTKMAYPGLQSDVDRANVIEYLASIAADGSVAGADTEAVATADQQAPADAAPAPLAKDTVVPEHGVLHLGRPALEQEIVAWDIDIRPDGTGLPAGSGTVEAGGVLYDAQCASCHGVFGEGEGRWPMLAGGFGTLTDDRPEKTIGSYWPFLSTVYDYVRRAMPFGNARSLSDDDVYALTAYLLYLNDLADEDFTLDSQSFATIEMPNAGNFIADNRAEEPGYSSDTEPCMSDCVQGEASVVMRARVLDVTPDSEESEGAGSID